MRCVLISLALAAQFLFAAPAGAQGLRFFETDAAPGVMVFNAGVFNIDGTRGGSPAVFQLDVVPDFTLVNVYDAFYVHPYVGGWVHTEGGVQAYVGVHGLLSLGDFIEARPFVAIGPYDKGVGKDLESDVLFHLGMGLFFVTEGGWRVGATFSHQSHFELLSSDTRNPGSNNILVSVAVPLDRLF